MNGWPQPDLVTTILRTRSPDPVGVAFHAIARLDEAQRQALADRFNTSFGQCTPKLAVRFEETPK